MSTIIPVHGNYQELESYRNGVIIYDGTVDFCNLSDRSDRSDIVGMRLRSNSQS